MKAEFYRNEVQTLIGMVESGVGLQSESIRKLSADHFTCPKRHAREQAMLRRMPLIVGHASQVAEPGDFFVCDDFGKSYLIVRGVDGEVRAFLNYCQHRGTRLAQVDSGSRAKRFTCPYHAWSYDTHGCLAAVPREDLFPGLDRESKHLKQARLDERFGLLWLTQEPDSTVTIDELLRGFERELHFLAKENTAMWFNKTRPLKANWKLPLDAFLESYHIAMLHRESVGAYFVRHVANSEHCGPHIRSFVPRANILELKELDWSEAKLRDYVSPSYIIFPNACFVLHPTSLSVLTVYPGAVPGESTWNHKLLIPKMPETEREKKHYDKSIRILDGVTYEAEDFWVSEQIQQGLDAGAIDELTLGLTEGLIREFHDKVEKASAQHAGASDQSD